METYAPESTINISEIRQWLYCPRVVWFGRELGDHRPTSAMMRVGIDEEAERRRLEARRTFSQYGIEALARRNQVPVWSERLRLRGLVDTLLELSATTLEQATSSKVGGKEQLFVPVEFKATMRREQRANTVQLATYGLCIEEMTATPVKYGFLVLLPSEEVIKQPLTSGIRKSVQQISSTIKAALEGTELPRPTPHRGKCQCCEFRRFCNDVW